MLRLDFKDAVGSGATAPNRGTPSGRRKGSPTFKMRLTPAERAALDEAANAAGLALASYIKLRLFNGLPPLTTYGGSAKRPTARPASDLQLIAKLLAALGGSRLASNLNQLAKAVNTGTLDVGPDTERELLEAYAAVQAMRRDLVAALGLKAQGGK